MSQIASTYGLSLYCLAVDENAAAEILEQMNAVTSILQAQPQFTQLLSAQNLTREERIAMVDTCFRGHVNPYFLNFLKILTEKGYIRHYDDCFREYRDAYYADNNVLPVSVVSAIELRPAQIGRLQDKLEELTGETVLLSYAVDEGCIGGIRLDYDGKRIDGTVSTRLKSVAELLKNVAF